MYPKLPNFETYFYIVTWILGVGYSVYHVFLLGEEYNLNIEQSTVSGWQTLEERRLASDYEWTTWVKFLPVYLLWAVLQILVAELIRWKNPKFLPLWYFVFSVVFFSIIIGPTLTVIMIFQPCIIFAGAFMRSRIAVWIVSLISFFVFCNLELGSKLFLIDEQAQYITLISMAWCNLRAISFCIDNLSEIHCGKLLCLLAYCFYLPTCTYGPLILYDKFEKSLSRPFMNWTWGRLGAVTLDMFRFLGWAIIAELSIRYFCFCLIQGMPDLVEKLKPWAFYGLGYCMGQFFMVKYTVMYGVSASFARIEQIDAPHHPKCIARIHLYSNMWRYFDQGLYFFLAKYIYIPCLGKNPPMMRKLFASFVCFSYVYIWHGLFLHVLVWSFLNFLGVTVEAFGKAIGSSLVYREWEAKFLSEGNSRRFKALISVPIFIMAAVSNFYFFAGYDVGNIYIKRILSGHLMNNAILFFFCYCCCQVSIEVSNWEEGRKHKLHKK